MPEWLDRLRAAGEPDPDLPPLTRRDADSLREQVASQLRARGALVHYDGHTAVITDARRGVVRVRLADVAREVAASQHPRAAEIAARKVVDMVLAEPSIASMNTADLYRGLRLRVTPVAVPAEDLASTEPEDSSVIDPFTLDTSVSLVLDTEQTVQTAPLAQLRKADDMDTLIRAARGNLLADLRAALVEVTRHQTNPQQAGAYFWAVESPSVYTASAALLLEEMLPQWVPELDASEGVLFAMPSRNALLLRPVTAGSELVEGLGAIAGAALEISHRSDKPLSPLLHLSYMGQVDTISNWDPDTRQLTITPTSHLLLRMQNG